MPLLGDGDKTLQLAKRKINHNQNDINGWKTRHFRYPGFRRKINGVFLFTMSAGSTFSAIASAYAARAVLQCTAADRLFALLALGPRDDVLDLGCGPGHLTQRLRSLTSGRVVGIDVSPAMVAEARDHDPGQRIEFAATAVETMDFTQTFDAIFCNSTFQWFRDPSRVLRRCHRALRAAGRIAVQAPTTSTYCVEFIRAAAALGEADATRATWKRYRNPFFMRETPGEFVRVFADAGFTVEHASIDDAPQQLPVSRAVAGFHSGAAMSYLNPACYDGAVEPEYFARASATIESALARQADTNGAITLHFRRLYLLARKVETSP